MDELLTRLDSVSNIGVVVERVTDCSFLFWHKALSDIRFQAVFDEELSSDQVELSLRALNDCCVMLRSARHCPETEAVANFANEIVESFRQVRAASYVMPCYLGISEVHGPIVHGNRERSPADYSLETEYHRGGTGGTDDASEEVGGTCGVSSCPGQELPHTATASIETVPPRQLLSRCER